MTDIIGVFFEGEKLQYARLHLNKKAVEIKLVEGLPRPSNNIKLVSGLSAHELILRKITLKLRSRHAIRRVLPFQAEASLPFSPEEMVLLPFCTRKAASESEVSLLATTRATIEGHLEKMRSLKLDPDQVSSAPSAISSFARHFFPGETDLFFLHIGEEKSFCGLISAGKLEQLYSFSLGSLSFSEQLLEKELDRAFIFLRKKTSAPPRKLLLTGQGFPSFDMRHHLEKTEGLSLLETSESLPFLREAIPVGLALEGMFKTGAQFRQGSFTPPKLEKRRKLLSLYAACSSLALTLFVALAGQIIAHSKRVDLEKRLASFSPAKNAEHVPLEEGISLCEEALSKEKPSFPIVSTAPKVSDLLAWLSSHPLLATEIDLKELRYELTKYPKVGGPKEPYLAKVELKFTASTPAAARLFREAITKGDALVNSKQEISWSMEQNIYRVSFPLKGVHP